MKESVFQINGKPKINRFNFLLNPDYELNNEISLEINNDVQIMKGIDENSNQAFVLLKIEVFKNQPFEKVPFTIELEIEGHFMWTQETDEETVEVLLRQNAPAILFSYTRPLITLITVEANLPPLRSEERRVGKECR